MLISICDILHDLVPFVQFKKCEKRSWRSITSSMGVFHVFQIIQMEPNRAKHHILCLVVSDSSMLLKNILSNLIYIKLFYCDEHLLYLWF